MRVRREHEPIIVRVRKPHEEGIERMPTNRMTKKKDHDRKPHKKELKGDRLRHAPKRAEEPP